jgi:hypothetical protein
MEENIVDIQKLADDLMVLHCQGCEGSHCGCSGCSMERETIEILKKHIKQKEEA